MRRQIFLILPLLLFIFSCSRTEENSLKETNDETSFFNLNVGNKWVYKTYERDDYTSELEFTGKIDSIEITSNVNLDNKTYSKVKHILRNDNFPNSPSQNRTYFEYWRVNESGHLVYLTSAFFDLGESSKETVKHPGKDYSFSFTETNPGITNYGNLIYKLYPETEIMMDNQSYHVSPYNGQFTPNSQYSGTILPKITENNYKENVGLVKSVCHSIIGTYNFEEHLVSYQFPN